MGRLATSTKEVSTLKKQISEIDRTVKEVKVRYACGKIDDDTFSVAIQEYSNRKDVLLLEMEKWKLHLSNYEAKIPVVIATVSKLGTFWRNGNLDLKKEIQKTVFPEGVFWDKKIRNYRTEKRNSVFDLLDRISDTYVNKKGPPLSEAVPLCG